MKFKIGDRVLLNEEYFLGKGYAYFGGYFNLLTHFDEGNPPVIITDYYPENHSYSIRGVYDYTGTFRVAEFEIKLIKNTIKKL